ncbi:MAG: ABC transporter ATP-binding protein [Spirochaetes bacterium]|nr:ABC transporter ATP-binding protein [Spirochaetota bacterium]
MININSLTYKKDDIYILKNINAVFHDSEINGIIGESGSGKTYFLNAIAGKLKDYDGEILINNENLNTLSAKEIEKQISLLLTKQTSDIIDDTVFNFLLQSRKMYKKTFNPFSDIDIQITEDYIRLMQLDSLKDKKILTLSEGILKRILIAATFIKDTDTLLLDNPAENLDLNSKMLLQKALIKYVMNGDKTVIISSNDLNFILNIADKIIIMKDGGIDLETNSGGINAEIIKKYFKTEVLLSRNIYNGRPLIQQFADTEG